MTERSKNIFRYRPESIKMPDGAEEWIAALKLSTRWGCPNLRQLAIKSMNQLKAFRCLDPVRKVIVGRDLHVQKWVMDGYHALATREDSISDEEMQMIGAVEAFRLERMRNLRSKNNRSDVSEEISREFLEELDSIAHNEKKYLNTFNYLFSMCFREAPMSGSTPLRRCRRFPPDEKWLS